MYSPPPPDPEGSAGAVRLNTAALRVVVRGVVLRVGLVKSERRRTRAGCAKVIINPNGRTAAGWAGPGMESILAGLVGEVGGSSLVGRVPRSLVLESVDLRLNFPRLLFKCLDVVRTGVATEFVIANAAGWTLSRGFAFTVRSGDKIHGRSSPTGVAPSLTSPTFIAEGSFGSKSRLPMMVGLKMSNAERR